MRIDEAVAHAFLDAITPAGIEAALLAEQNLKRAMKPPAPNGAFRSRRPATRPNGQNGVTVRWSRRTALWPVHWKPNGSNDSAELASAEAELARRLPVRGSLRRAERTRIRALGADLRRYGKPPTTHRDRKELLHALLEEVNIAVADVYGPCHFAMERRAVSELDVAFDGRLIPPVRTDEETIDLIVASRSITPMPSSPVFSTGRADGRLLGTGSPRARWAICAGTGRSPGSSQSES